MLVPGTGARLSASGSSVPARAGVWAGQDRLQWPSPTPDGRYLYFHSSLFAGNNRQLKRIELRAPQSGIVHELTVHTVGGVINAGEPVMLIVPRFIASRPNSLRPV